ncbi:MAG: hypothetical protein E7212_11110 [Clostridium sartagoforme]|nr:hypothetical protein [Clostridium sartagoforme]
MLSLNYIANDILNNNSEGFLYYNVLDNQVIKVLKEIVSHYLFNGEQILILSNSHIEYILEDSLFKDFGKRLINLNNNYNVKELVSHLLSNLQEQTGKTIISKVELIDRSIKKKYDLLIKINNIFNAPNNSGTSLIDKYIITEKRFSTTHPYHKYYRTFRIKKPFISYKYTDLKEACNKILSENICKSYIKYRRFIDNDIFKCLKEPIDYNLINDAIKIINDIINNKKIDYSLILSKYTEDFLDAFFENEIINNESILSLSNIVNLKYNYELLNRSVKKKWFNFFNKINEKKEEYNLKIYSNLSKEIYDEYISNYNTIIKLKDSIAFLKSVLKEDVFNEEVVSIIKNENPYDKLEFYKKLLETTYRNKESFNIINCISQIEEDILQYCYDDLEEKKDIEELIAIIPILKAYLDIEEEEVKNLDIINIYKDYDKIIDSIYDDNNKKSSLISKGINNIWDNKLRDASSILTENINYMSNEVLNKFFPCIVSNYTKENIEYLSYKKFSFDKIIIITEDNNNNDFEDLNKLGTNIICFKINNEKSNNIDNNEENISDINNRILSEVKFYLKNRNNTIDVSIKSDHIELIINNNKIFILLDTLSETNRAINDNIFLYKYYKEKNINMYRLWYRDWWINKSKELEKIESYINNLTIESK